MKHQWATALYFLNFGHCHEHKSFEVRLATWFVFRDDICLQTVIRCKSKVHAKCIMIIRKKTITIPYILNNNIPHFLMVRDSKYHEYTFPSGGCRSKHESPRESALRELYEETCTTLQLSDFDHFDQLITFYSDYRSEEESKADRKYRRGVLVQYDVFFGKLASNDTNQYISTYRNAISRSSMMKKEFRETDEMAFFTIDQISSVIVWDFMKNVTLPNVLRFLASDGHTVCERMTSAVFA